MTRIAVLLRELYDILYHAFGPQGWWPGDTPFEVALGAILTQNTNWTNVARVIAALKADGLLDPLVLRDLPPAKLAERFRPAGYYNLKAARVHNFLALFAHCFADPDAAPADQDLETLRARLLAVKGIGPETADSILLYAWEQPVFVVDAYTYRILSRHDLAFENSSYAEMQGLFMDHLPADVPYYQEYHALLVRLGKEYCRPTPRCRGCPLESWPSRDAP
jgi:endonuclease-3 related protein